MFLPLNGGQLSIVDKVAGPSVSATKRFHCTAVQYQFVNVNVAAGLTCKWTESTEEKKRCGLFTGCKLF